MFLSLFNYKIWYRLVYLIYLYLPLLIKIYFYGFTINNIINLKNKLLNSGYVFIKISQWLINRPDILNQKIILELRLLQTKCSEYPLNILLDENKNLIKIVEVNDQIIKVNHNLDIIEINKNPIGVGSIAQVHRGILYKTDTKTDIIIKFRHPNIIQNMEIDLTLVYWIAQIINLKYNFMPICDIKLFLKEVYTQANLTIEDKNLNKLQNVFKNKNIIYLPTIIYAADTYIIETFCPGIHINMVKNKNEYINARVKLLHAYILMVTNGYIHTDLHDGNVLVNNDLVHLIDFGMMVTLTPLEMKAVRYLLKGYYNFYKFGIIDGLVTAANFF